MYCFPDLEPVCFITSIFQGIFSAHLSCQICYNKKFDIIFLSFFLWIYNLCIYGCAENALLCGLSLAVESQGYSLAVVHRFLILVAPLVAEQTRCTASVAAAHGLSCVSRALKCTGFNSCGDWLSTGNMDFIAPRNVESSQTRDWTCVPGIGRQGLSPCATRESLIFLIVYNL